MSRAKVFSIPNNNLVYPEFMYVDTNAVVEIGLNRRYKQQIMDFILAAVANDTMLVYSPHMLEELKQTIHVNVLNKEMRNSRFRADGNNPKAPWKQFEDTNVNVGPTTIAEFNNIIADLGRATSNTFYDLGDGSISDIGNLTNKYMEVGIAPKDAKHAAIMDHNQINNVLTVDNGFTKIPNINIYSPNITPTVASPNDFISILDFTSNNT